MVLIGLRVQVQGYMHIDDEQRECQRKEVCRKSLESLYFTRIPRLAFVQSSVTSRACACKEIVTQRHDEMRKTKTTGSGVHCCGGRDHYILGSHVALPYYYVADELFVHDILVSYTAMPFRMEELDKSK